MLTKKTERVSDENESTTDLNYRAQKMNDEETSALNKKYRSFKKEYAKSKEEMEALINENVQYK